MKKIIYAFLVLSCTLSLTGQNAAPNGGFEAWTLTPYEYPTGYAHSAAESFYRCGMFNITKSTDAYNGLYSLQLTTAISSDTCFAYIVSSVNASGNNPCNWAGGIPFSQTPGGIKGYYKSNVMPGDSAGILVAFRNNGVCVGQYMYKFAGVQNTYAPFSFTFNPPLSGTPDTMIFAAVSSDVFNGMAINGSMLMTDSVSLIGVTQPPGLNGNFENWSGASIQQLNGWYNQSQWSGDGVNQTTDANTGQFAAELTTYPGDNNGVPRANSGGISTGYYLNNCSGSNCQKGGYPFTNQIDTLCFYYKFAPLNGDSAYVGLNFKNMGSAVNSTGYFIPNAAATYQYLEVPFNAMVTIDTVIISFQSSGWNDTTLASVGTVLKVDDVFFKSQPGGMSVEGHASSALRNIYPNPNNGSFTVDQIGKHDLVRILNVYGQEVPATITKQNNKAQVQISTPGAYLIYVNAKGKISQQKVLVGKE